MTDICLRNWGSKEKTCNKVWMNSKNGKGEEGEQGRSMVDVDEGETSVGKITVLTLKRHLHLGDPRSGRWISRADETPVHRRLCNSNRAAARQRLDKCRWEKIGGDSRPRDGQDNGMFRGPSPTRETRREVANSARKRREHRSARSPWCHLRDSICLPVRRQGSLVRQSGLARARKPDLA